MLDPQIAELYARRDEAGIQPTFAGNPSGTECRERYASFHALITKPGLPEGMSREERRLGQGGADGRGVPVVILRPREATDRVIAFFHGGGFVVGSPDTHLDHAARLAEVTGAVVVSVEYALAPERAFPAAWKDAASVVEELARHEERVGGRLVAVAGDSAGGNLALNMAIHLRDLGVGLAAQLLIYPATDLVALNSIPSHASTNGLYAGSAPLEDPRLSPIRADLAGLPPTVLTVGSEDFLVRDNQALAAALREAEVQLHLQEPDGLPHGYFHLGAMSEAAEAAATAAVEELAGLLADA